MKSIQRFADIECELTDLRDAYESLLSSHKKMRSRIGMRRKREQDAQAAQDGMPDPAAPDWKQRARVHLAQAGKLNARFHTGK